MRRDFPFRNILVFLFPLIHQSVSFAQILSRMLGEGGVRSSELETSLPLFEQDDASEVSSQKTPFKALKVCTLKRKDGSRIRNRF